MAPNAYPSGSARGKCKGCTLASRRGDAGQGLQLPCHLDHGSAETEAFEEALRALVPLGGPEHHSRGAAIMEPLGCCRDESGGDPGAATALVDNHVVDEP